jgi:hypothetical protein
MHGVPKVGSATIVRVTIPVRLIVRDASPYSAATEHLAEAEALADELRRVGFEPVEVDLAPPPAGAPMASGVTEWLMVYLGGPAITLVVADLYKRCKRWARDRIARPENRALRYGRVIILDENGEAVRRFQISQLPDGTLIEQDDEVANEEDDDSA